MNNLKQIFNIPNCVISIVIVFAIIAQTIPLVQVLNFEFSFLFSIILFIASGILTIHYLRKFKTFGVLPAIIMMKKKVYFLLLLSPLLISIISNLSFQICPFWDGILYYLVLVIPAFYFGFVSGAFAFWSNKKLAYLIFIGIFLLFAFAPILEFYIYPQVYFFNVIVGIIPGTIYDESILITGKLIFFRLLHFVLFSLLLYSMFKVGSIKEKNRKILMLSTLLGAVLFFLLKPYFGYATTKYTLHENLKMSILSSSFEIRYSENLTQDNVQLLGLEHFYYMQEIGRKTMLSTPKNIVAYIFKDANQKGALFGSKAANVAKPWMNEIYLDFQSVENTLEHELTHIYAAQIGSTPFKIADAFNMAMLEGYAMAIEDNYSGYDIHYMALLAKESGYNFNIPELFSKFNFFGQNSSLSYITAGSFVKYLMEVYGIEKVNKVYQDLDFEKYFAKDLNELSNEYVVYLDNLNYPINKHRANLFFGRNPITKKVCPRSVSNDLKSAWDLYSNRSYFSSLTSFTRIYEYSNSYSALIGVLYSNNKLGLYKESLKLIEDKISEFKGTSSYYSALLNLGDQYSYNADFKRADEIYNLLSSYQPTERYKSIADTRIELLQTNQIVEYLKGSDFDKYNVLKTLNNNKLFDSSIPILIELSNRLNENISTFSTFLEGKQLDNLSSNSSYLLSKYFMKNLEFEKTLFFAEQSVEKCKNNFEMPILQSHLKKVKWMKK